MTRRPTQIRKHSLVVAGHRTSVTLEEIFWEHLNLIAATEGVSLNALATRIDANRSGNLSSALRVFVLNMVADQYSGSLLDLECAKAD
mgnify:CR=1 FL=1